MRRKYFIDTLDLMTTTECNLSCKKCYGHLSQNPTVKMDLDMAKRATKFALHNIKPPATENHLSIMFFGGEPTLNWDLIKDYTLWIEEENYRKTFNFSLEIFTNGLLLDEQKIDYLLKKGFRIYISIDGTYEDQMVRRPMSRKKYDHILSMVEYIIAQGKASDLNVYTVIKEECIKRTIHILEYFQKIGIKNIQLSKDLLQDIDQEQRESLFKTVKSFISKYQDMNLLFNPENSSDCKTCEPKAILAYPNGDIFDLCYLCTQTLATKNELDQADANPMFIGNLAHIDEIYLDVEKKKSLIRKKMFCPTIHRQNDYLNTHNKLE